MSVIQQHLDAIAASMQLTLAQIDAARHAIRMTAPTTAPAHPPQCEGIPEEQCAFKDDGAKRAVMGGAYICTGCAARFDAHLGT
jgi:hypothetical protein